MKIQSRFEIKTDAKAAIKFTGLMGQNFLSIEGGSSAAPAIQSGSLDTIEQPDLSALMAKLEGVAGGIENLTKSFSTDNMSTLLGPLTDFVKQSVAAADMIQATDVAEAVRMLLRLTPGCVIPEIIFQAPGAMPAGLPA